MTDKQLMYTLLGSFVLVCTIIIAAYCMTEGTGVYVGVPLKHIAP